jgi:ornithine cyclodeaminase
VRIIDSDAVLDSIDPLTIVEALRRGHRQGVDAVDRSLLSEPAGETNHFLIWPAWTFGAAAGAKLVTVFPENEARGRGPNIRSVYVLFDGADGRPLCVITGDSFTRYKTAADSALGAAFLARAGAEVLTVIGAGAQAETHIRLLCVACPSIARVLVWNRTAAKAEHLAARLKKAGIDAVPSDDREAAVRQADIVSCLTSAASPVLRGAWLKSGAHVDLVGSFTPAMREADDETMRRGRIFVDSRFWTLKECGDLADPIARGILRETDVVGDLFDLCLERVPGRTTHTEITIFKNGGGGHLDLMVARCLYEHTEAAEKTFSRDREKVAAKQPDEGSSRHPGDT